MYVCMCVCCVCVCVCVCIHVFTLSCAALWNLSPVSCSRRITTEVSKETFMRVKETYYRDKRDLFET